MISISRSMLLAAGLLAFSVASAMAQQSDAGGGAALKSTTPGNAGTSSSAMDSAATGGTTLKSTTMGDSGKKVVPDARGNASGNGPSTGPTGNQPK